MGNFRLMIFRFSPASGFGWGKEMAKKDEVLDFMGCMRLMEMGRG